MSDQATPEQGAETAAVDTPNGTDTQETANWEERYKEAQSWATRTAQEAAQYRQQVEQFQNPEYQEQVAREWLSQQGYTIPDDEAAGFDEPSPYATREEVEELKQWRESQETNRQKEEVYAAFREEIDPQLAEMGVPEEFIEPVAQIVSERPGIQTPQGVKPDLQGAYEQFTQVAQAFAGIPLVQDHVLKNWRESKRTPRAPGSGQAATQTKSLDDMNPQELLEWQMQQLQNMET